MFGPGAVTAISRVMSWIAGLVLTLAALLVAFDIAICKPDDVATLDVAVQFANDFSTLHFPLVEPNHVATVYLTLGQPDDFPALDVAVN